MKVKTIYNTEKLIENAKREGFTHGIIWTNPELGKMIDLYTFPIKGSKKLK